MHPADGNELVEVSDSDSEDSEEAVDSSELLTQREELLRSRVMDIYADCELADREHRYCSEAYLELYDRVVEHDAASGEIGFIDWDHWTNAQDGPDNPAYQIVNLKMMSPDEAIVSVREHEANTGADLKMVWERNNWYVDDFLNQSTPPGEKERITNYLEN